MQSVDRSRQLFTVRQNASYRDKRGIRRIGNWNPGHLYHSFGLGFRIVTQDCRSSLWLHPCTSCSHLEKDWERKDNNSRQSLSTVCYAYKTQSKCRAPNLVEGLETDSQPVKASLRTLVSLDLTRTLLILKCSTSLSHRQVSTKSPTLVRESRTRKSPLRKTRVSDTWTEKIKEEKMVLN